MTVHVHWFCGCYVGPCRFDWDEPDDCEAEFETTEEVEDWSDGLCSAECPSCHQILCQSDGHATLL